MNDTSKNNSDNQEIDLSQVSKKIGVFFENISTSIFRGFLFLKRNLIIISILFIIGVALGFYLDKTNKTYDNQIIVSPNFGSVDYLYSKINLINSKIINSDTLFLRNIIGIKEPKNLRKIEIKPVNDIYKFIENKQQNFDLLKLMAEDGDINKIVEDKLTSKNYPYHSINYITLNETSSEKTLEPLLNFLNNDEYFSIIQRQYINNLNLKIIENDSIITQINGLLNAFSDEVNSNQKSDKLVYYNENSQLNEIINTKNNLILEQGNNKIALLNLDKIVKVNSSSLNTLNIKGVNGKLKFILPLILVALFILVGLIKAYYKRQMTKLNS